MKVRNFLHKGLQRFYEGGSSKGLPVGATDKLAKMLAVLDALRGEDQLRSLQFWRPHQLTGERKGTWSLSVTRNWRLTFWIDGREPAICDVNLEDYH